jgi:hypothetical protein
VGDAGCKVARLQISVNVTAFVHDLCADENFLKHAFDSNRIRDALLVHDVAQVAVGGGHDQEARADVVHQPPAFR